MYNSVSQFITVVKCYTLFIFRNKKALY